MVTEFRLPELGENIETATVLKVLVQEGDALEADQLVIEIETDKATIEVPVDAGAVVREIKVSEGGEVKPGEVVLVLDSDGAAPEEPAVDESKDPAKPEEAPDPPSETPAETPSGDSEPQTGEPEQEPPAREPRTSSAEPEPAAPSTSSRPPGKTAPAAPSVRHFAREIGIDIHQVEGTGPGGRIRLEDVKAFARASSAGGGVQAVPASAPVALPDFERWGPVRREPMNKVRRVIARRLSQSWSAIPHVHQFDEADVTGLEQARREHNNAALADAPRLTVTAFLVKLAAHALKRYPALNVSLDPANEEIVYKEYRHIGVAVNTEEALLVPVIRDAGEKSILEIAAELTEISQRARDGKLGLEEMQGGTFTITNLGGIGGTNFTPIVNPPEAAILGVARAARRPVADGDGFVSRLILPLSLGYDHRLIDGALAARFLREIAERLENPFEFLLEI